MLAALYSEDPEPEPEYEPKLPRCEILDLTDELLYEVLLHVAAREPASLAKMERVASHFWQPRRPLTKLSWLVPTTLPRGARVMIHSCQSKVGQALNGRFATVCGYDKAAGRYVLAFAGVERRKKLQHGNVTLVASVPEVAAATVVSRRDDRWRVEPRSGESWKRVLHVLYRCLPPLRMVSCGSMHTAAVDPNGRVWSCGLGTNGQLGHGPSSDFTPHVDQIVGNDGASTVSEWGEGRNFRSAPTHASLLENEREFRPRLVNFDTCEGDQCTIAMSAVVAGGGSTFALAGGNGQLWAWGRLADRNCTGVEEFIATPSQHLFARPVSVVSARDNHAALVTSAGTLFTWGEGSQGQLGHGFGVDYDKPREVEVPATRGALGCVLRPNRNDTRASRSLAPRITNVACSSFATAILTEYGELCVTQTLRMVEINHL